MNSLKKSDKALVPGPKPPEGTVTVVDPSDEVAIKASWAERMQLEDSAGTQGHRKLIMKT